MRDGCCFTWVVRDEQSRNVHVSKHRHQVALKLVVQVGIEARQRFVEQ